MEIHAQLIMKCDDNWVEGLIVTSGWGTPQNYACHRIGGETEEIAIGNKNNGTYTRTLEAAMSDMERRSKAIYTRHGVERSAMTVLDHLRAASSQLDAWIDNMQDADYDPTADILQGIENAQA